MKKILLIFLSVFAFVSAHAAITWEFSDDGTLTISGTDMPNYHYNRPPSWYSKREQIKKVVIKSGVTNIGNYAFDDCYNLTSITIPNSVTSIGESAFAGCIGLTSITIPNSVTGIGDYAFGGCSGLASISIPNSVTSIGDRVFSGCSELTSITISNSITRIGSATFYNCSSLTSITIPNSVTSIGTQAFGKCSGLTSITIPNSVTSIGDYVFAGCSSLTSITIPNSVTSIWDYAFGGCSGLTSITIPNSVTNIGNYAFAGCSGLTSITIPNSVTSIGYYTFFECSSLTSVTIPNSVTSIGGGIFQYCIGLTSITIGKSVTSIGERIFTDCSNLKEIFFWNATPPTILSKTFEDVNTIHVKLFVPEGAGDAYKSAPWWREFHNIYEMEYTPVLSASSPITISDAAPSRVKGYYKENTVTYSRESSAISEDNYASFCLPFAVDATDTQFKAVYVPVGLSLYNEEANTLRIGFYKTDDILPAGTPFLARLAVNDKIEVKNALPVNYSDKTPNVKSCVIRTYNFSEDNGIMNENTSYAINFSGTYSNISPANANTFNTDGSVGPSANVVPFRAYIDLAKNSSNAKILSLFDEDSETTGIRLIESAKHDGAAYNLAGQRVSPLKAKGIIIINGKKYVK